MAAKWCRAAPSTAAPIRLALTPASSTSSGQALFQGAKGPEETDVVTLEFLTPTTLKVGSGVDRDGTIVHRPAFHHVIKRLRDRINALATFYGSGPLDLDFKAIGATAEAIETVDDHTRWVERVRYSRRRDTRHDLSGFVGTITFRGHVAPFLPLLRLGEYVHVGKCREAHHRGSQRIHGTGAPWSH